jgi:hypothetical protein
MGAEEAAETFKTGFETGEDLYDQMEDEELDDEGGPSFTGDVEELPGEEAFGVGVEAGRQDAIEDVIEKVKQLLKDPYAMEMEEEEEIPVEEYAEEVEEF